MATSAPFLILLQIWQPALLLNFAIEYGASFKSLHV